MEQTVPAAATRLSPLILSLVVTLAMVVIAWQRNSAAALAVAVPVAFATYLLYFAIGTEPLASRLQQWCAGSVVRTLHLPLALMAGLALYVLSDGGDPLQGNSWQIPLLFCAPVLFYRLAIGGDASITWKDVVGGLLCILPFALHDFPFSSDLPAGGGGIDTLYLTLAIIVAVYALVVVRRLPAVGFVPFYSRDALLLVAKWWAFFFLLVLAIGIPGGLIRWVGFEPLSLSLLVAGLALFLRTLFGTALPEELFFRALFLNLLRQRLVQSGTWQRYLYGALLLLPLALWAGYTTPDQAQWFPLLCAALLWLATWRHTRSHPEAAAPYTALLIVGVLFGLAHYHIHSTLFMGLAMVAGWIYGHLYMKTGSVFYSALTHTLVNVSPMLFGFELVR